MGMSRNTSVERLYTPKLEEARARVRADETLAAIIDETADPRDVMGFLIQFSALGVFMTDKVEDWIRRAGERCTQLGHTALGRALVMHAKHEAGHHHMMIEDLNKLIPRWNEAYAPPLDASALLAQTPTSAMQRYVDIHEDTIASEQPYGQIAIEYEIEKMSTVLGPVLMNACARALGREVIEQMSFIEEHAALDVGHTAMNEVELDKFLAKHPEQAQRLAEIGAEALGIYLDFLGDCVRMGRSLGQQVRASA
ncbi:MAG: hypothetical protein KDC14_03555 [Planctomycetes bacterium]|nr:hypothetical protein [Planctomycetota bacterium]